jgi:hypothetical protein
MVTVKPTWTEADGKTRSLVFQRHHQDLHYILAHEAQAKGDVVAAAEHYQAALHRAIDELQKRGDGAKIGCIARVLQDLVENTMRPSRGHA